MSSSIWSVLRGSSAEHGSSIRITSGSVAIARAMHSRCCWPPDSASPDCLSLSLTSSQMCGPAKAGFDEVVNVALVPDDPRPECDVVVDRLRERVRLLEDHADPAADLDRIDVTAVHIDAVVEHLAFDADPGDQVVHAVDRPQERRLAAAGWPDERGDLLRPDVDRDVLHRAERAVIEVQVPEADDRLGRGCVPCGERLRVVGHREPNAAEPRSVALARSGSWCLHVDRQKGARR